MSRRKWTDSGVAVTTVEALLNCINDYGGAMYYGGFHRKHLFLNQQLGRLVMMLDRRHITYPKLNEANAKAEGEE